MLLADRYDDYLHGREPIREGPGVESLLYVEHLKRDGARFFELVCEQDLEGIICKPKTSRYPFTWLKVKNPNDSQGIGRGKLCSAQSEYRVGPVVKYA
jgi:hypothetical protein